MWFGLKIVEEVELQELRREQRESRAMLELPFFREVERICKEHPEYLDGIAQGTVSIRFLPGYSPFEKAKRERRVTP